MVPIVNEWPRESTVTLEILSDIVESPYNERTKKKKLEPIWKRKHTLQEKSTSIRYVYILI